MRVNDLARTPISPPAFTGAGTTMPRAKASIARVICTSGRDSDRARKNTTGSAASATTSAPRMLGNAVVPANSLRGGNRFYDSDARATGQPD